VIVVDANVIVYLVALGSNTPAAKSVFQHDPDWRAPPLWRSEVRNALVGHMRWGGLQLATAVAAMGDAERLLRAGEEYVDSRRVLELAVASGRSAYDCEYIALAEHLDVPLVTADHALLQAFPGTTRALDSFASPGT
jgi:predicted nucleic acid-binding protein